MKKIFLILTFLLFISCNKNNNEEIKSTNDDGDLEVEIVSNKNKTSFTKILDEKDYEDMYSKELVEKFKKYNINIHSIVEAERLALLGDVDAINNLTYVYNLIKEDNKFKEILKLGDSFNIEDSTFNLAILEFQNKNYYEALRYIEKLSKDYKKSEVKNLKSSIYREKAFIYFVDKKYDETLKFLLNVYQLGDKEVAYDISNIYHLMQDEKNYIKWLEIAANGNNIYAIKKIAGIYAKNNQNDKAIIEYKKIYEKGDFLVAKNIYESYLKLGDIKEIIKWYKISRNLQIIRVDKEIEKIIKIYGEE